MLQLAANRPIHAKVKGDPSYSFNVSYEVTKKIDLKLAVSRSFKQPTLESAAAGLLSGNGAYTVSENTTRTAPPAPSPSPIPICCRKSR